ncbi:MAG: phospho-N-acetylmuramoyl-pentapeptide-transferase [Actinomycetota bacterium]|nr:phospho-N-acetylmuramoyl-pentapeptide-transferase [Actinomycetota bacterium]
MIQVVLAALVALAVTLFGTPLLIALLRRHGYSQAIRVSKDGIQYPEHQGKKGTPSMGGLAIIIAVVLGYAVAHLAVWRPPTVSGLLCLYLMVGLGLVGMADDYLKIFKQRSTGVRARTKLVGQASVALSFAVMSLYFPDEFGRTPASQAISFIRDTPIVLPMVLAVLWIWLLITATTNAVNLTDGLDGLAAGASVATFAAFALLGVWQFGQNCSFSRFERCYEVRDPLDLAVFAAACGAACVGFLWWNTSPARIFMGDTGSLAIGGAIAALAIFSQTELLLVAWGGLFLLTTLSVILQVGSYKLTGKRIFRMAPLHHHFELKGWGEVTIVTRFWILQGLFVGAGLTLFYAEWVRT